MSKRPIVCDTTVMLYLARIGRVDLLSELFGPIYVPQQVLLELDMGRRLRRDTIDPRDAAWATTVTVPQEMMDTLPPNRLGAGEQAVIAYAYHGNNVAALDDFQARQLADTLGLAEVGTLGILLRAKKAGLVPAIHPLIDALASQGFRYRTGPSRLVGRCEARQARRYRGFSIPRIGLRRTDTPPSPRDTAPGTSPGPRPRRWRHERLGGR